MATEKRLIDANSYIEEYQDAADMLRKIGGKEMNMLADFYCEIIKEIEKRPTVDAVEVVRGEWTIIEDDYCGLIGLECSHCEKTWWFDEESPIGEYHFCPGCGADMRGDGNGT